jgi:hypothetical protein
MKRQNLLLSVFPVTLLGLMGAERLTTFLLGTYPSEPALWRAWLELRAIFRPLSLALDAVVTSLALQVCIMAMVAGVVLIAAFSRKHLAIGFLLNHAALIVAAISISLGGDRRVASSGFVDANSEFSLVLQFSPLAMTLIAAGIAACAYCHLAYLAEARKTPARLRIAELQRAIQAPTRLACR